MGFVFFLAAVLGWFFFMVGVRAGQGRAIVVGLLLMIPGVIGLCAVWHPH